MPYVGPRLADHIDTGAGDRFCRRTAADAGDHWHFVTAQNTPVATGNLRTSWYKDPPISSNKTRHMGFPAYEVIIATDVPYAPYVEWDTKPHEIRPKPPNKALRFRDAAGNEVFAARVQHPGTRGQHMLAIGAHMTEANLDSIALPAGELFVRELEEVWRNV